MLSASVQTEVDFRPLQGPGPLQYKMQRPLPEPEPLQGTEAPVITGDLHTTGAVNAKCIANGEIYSDLAKLVD